MELLQERTFAHFVTETAKVPRKIKNSIISLLHHPSSRPLNLLVSILYFLMRMPIMRSVTTSFSAALMMLPRVASRVSMMICFSTFPTMDSSVPDD
jgi:hypothetical protein